MTSNPGRWQPLSSIGCQPEEAAVGRLLPRPERDEGSAVVSCPWAPEAFSRISRHFAAFVIAPGRWRANRPSTGAPGRPKRPPRVKVGNPHRVRPPDDPATARRAGCQPAPMCLSRPQGPATDMGRMEQQKLQGTKLITKARKRTRKARKAFRVFRSLSRFFVTVDTGTGGARTLGLSLVVSLSNGLSKSSPQRRGRWPWTEGR